MHDAYEAVPILEKLPLKIESVACYGDLSQFLSFSLLFSQKFSPIALLHLFTVQRMCVLVLTDQVQVLL